MIDNPSPLTDEQRKGIEFLVKDFHNEISVLTNTSNPSFTSVMEQIFKATKQVDKFKTLFPHFDNAWKALGYKVEEGETSNLYNKFFDGEAEDIAVMNGIENLFETTETIVNNTPEVELDCVESEKEVLNKEEDNMPKSTKDNKETSVEKKGFKTLLGDAVSIFFGGVMLLILFGFVGQQIYKDFTLKSQELQFLIFGILTYSLMGFLIIHFALRGSLGVTLDKIFSSKWGVFLFLLFPFIVIVIVLAFVILVGILIFILTHWFIWVTIIMLILTAFIWFSPFSILKKLLLTALIVLTIYFFFEAKDILEFHFKFHFD